MESILKEHERLEKKGNLRKGIEDVQRIIDQLQAARNGVEAGETANHRSVVKLKANDLVRRATDSSYSAGETSVFDQAVF